MSVQASLFRLYSRYQMARLPDDPIRQRAAMEKYASLLKLPSDVGCEQFNVSNVPCEWITTPSAHPDWIHFHLHGGAYYMGSSRSHRDLVSRIGRAAGMRSLSIDYRLAPEYPFPAALEDATNVYRWLLVEGFDPTKIVLTGASAGGALALALLIYLRQAGDPLPAGAVCLSPWTDLALTGESVVLRTQHQICNYDRSSILSC